MKTQNQEDITVFKSGLYIKVPQVFAHLGADLDLTQVRMLNAIACEMQPRINRHFQGNHFSALFSEEELQRENVIPFAIPADFIKDRCHDTKAICRAGVKLAEMPMIYTFRNKEGQRDTRQEPIFNAFRWDTISCKNGRERKSNKMYFYMRSSVARRIFCSPQGYIMLLQSVADQCRYSQTLQLYLQLAGFRTSNEVALRPDVLRLLVGDARWDDRTCRANTDTSRSWRKFENMLQRAQDELKAMAMCGESDLCFNYTLVPDERHRRADPLRLNFRLIRGNEPAESTSVPDPVQSTAEQVAVPEGPVSPMVVDELSPEQQASWRRTIENLYRRIDDHVFLDYELSFLGLHRVEGDVAVLCTSSYESRSRWPRNLLQILVDETCAQLPGVYRIKFEVREDFLPITLRIPIPRHRPHPTSPTTSSDWNITPSDPVY